MSVLEQIRLDQLMAQGSGRSDVAVALLDGPVATGHPDFASARIECIGGQTGACDPRSSACVHGTFVAGILVARRGSAAPAICPGCSLLLRPIFAESRSHGVDSTATPGDVAQAIVECVDTGARVLNLSAAIDGPSIVVDTAVTYALDYAMQSGSLVVAAAGNQGTLGSSSITRHPGVIPVVAYDSTNRPMADSNLGASIGRRGLGAPGETITSLGAHGGLRQSGGTSSSAPFVSGTIALLWSAFPAASAAEIRRSLTSGRRRATVAPPLLDAWAAYKRLEVSVGRVEAASR